LAQKYYFGFGSNDVNLASRSNSIQPWKPDVQQNQVGLQLFRFPNRFKSVGRNADNLKVEIFTKLLKDILPPSGKIIYDENADK
jgi:hypothetical protein